MQCGVIPMQIQSMEFGLVYGKEGGRIVYLTVMTGGSLLVEKIVTCFTLVVNGVYDYDKLQERGMENDKLSQG